MCLDQKYYTVEDVNDFMRKVFALQPMLSDVRTVIAASDNWKESAANSFHSIVQTQGISPNHSGRFQINTKSYRSFFSLSLDYKDLCKEVGKKLETLMISSNSQSSMEFNGWVELARAGVHISDSKLPDRADNCLIDASDFGTNYPELFKQMYYRLDDKFKRNTSEMRFYVPTDVADNLDAERAMGIQIIGVPSMGNNFMLTRRDNIYACYHRHVEFIVHELMAVIMRCAPAIAVPEAVVLAQNVQIDVSVEDALSRSNMESLMRQAIDFSWMS